MTNYSNPRLTATIAGWPSGSKRVTATFTIERTPRGERAVRTTTGKPVTITYSRHQRIVDGDDGRTYVARDHGAGMVSILRGDMKYQHEIAHYPSLRFTELLSLFESPSPIACPSSPPADDYDRVTKDRNDGDRL